MYEECVLFFVFFFCFSQGSDLDLYWKRPIIPHQTRHSKGQDCPHLALAESEQ